MEGNEVRERESNKQRVRTRRLTNFSIKKHQFYIKTNK